MEKQSFKEQGFPIELTLCSKMAAACWAFFIIILLIVTDSKLSWLLLVLKASPLICIFCFPIRFLIICIRQKDFCDVASGS